MLIRRAEIHDIPDIDRLLLQVLTVHHNGRPDLFKADTRKYTDSELENIITDDNRPIFVAETERGVVGYAFCIFKQYPNDNILTDIKTLYIDDICVDETERGTGVGRRLYEHVVSFAEKSGCYNLTLNVWSCNESAIGFYEKCGLVPQKIGMEKIL